MSKKKLKICTVAGCIKKAKKKDRYCSMHRGRLIRWGTTEQQTYMAKIMQNVVITPNDCWEWQGYINKWGYARRRFNGKKMLVHRFVYQEIFGRIHPNMLVCHHCDNPKCVNPQHLFIGSHKDNIQDCIKKGRFKGHLNSPFKEGNQYAKKR